MSSITITGTVTDLGIAVPTSGMLTFQLSDYFIDVSGRIVATDAKTCNVSAVDGSFSITLESTLDGTPSSRSIGVSLSGVIGGISVSLSLGSIQLAASPGSVLLKDLIIAGLAGQTGSAPSIAGTAPALILRETDRALPLGLWQLKLDGDMLTLEKNTAVAGDFSTKSTFLSLSSSGIWTFTKTAIGVTSTDGMVLQNTTAAAAGAQQYSPRFRLTGQGWKTNATAASQTVDWVLENQPVQGAANPTTNLVISSQVNGGGYTGQLTLLSGGGGFLGTDPGGSDLLRVGGTLRALRLGLGTPADGSSILKAVGTGAVVQITGSGAQDIWQTISNTTTTGDEFIALAETVTGSDFYIQRYNSAYASPTANQNAVDIWNTRSGFMRFATNNLERMRIDSSGNVAIGATTASKKLTINDASSSSTTIGHSEVIRIGGGNAANSTLSEIGLSYGGSFGDTYAPIIIGYQLTNNSSFTKGDFYIATRNVITDTAPTERFRITAAGNVSVSGDQVSVTGGGGSGTSAAAFYAEGNTGTTINGIVIKDTGTSYGSANQFIVFINSTGGTAGKIVHDGASTVAFTTSSDSRLKRDLGIATTTDVLRKLVIHDFVWLDGGMQDRGVFAQEAYGVSPRHISVGSDELTDAGTLKNPWSVDYSKYVPDIIVGWQQHDDEITALKARLAQLEAGIKFTSRCDIASNQNISIRKESESAWVISFD